MSSCHHPRSRFALSPSAWLFRPWNENFARDQRDVRAPRRFNNAAVQSVNEFQPNHRNRKTQNATATPISKLDMIETCSLVVLLAFTLKENELVDILKPQPNRWNCQIFEWSGWVHGPWCHGAKARQSIKWPPSQYFICCSKMVCLKHVATSLRDIAMAMAMAELESYSYQRNYYQLIRTGL